MLIRIVSSYFVAGIVIKDGFCDEAAPIVKYMLGWNHRACVLYIERKHWSYTEHGETKTRDQNSMVPGKERP
jgi:hypothetical protein